MVLFDEDPTTLLRETTAQFHIAPDRDSLSRITDSLNALSTARQSRIDQQNAILKSLARQINGLQEGRRWEEEHHDAGGFAERMDELDREHFRVMKGAKDAEIETERLEGELVGLKAQLEALEKQGVEGSWRKDSDAEDELVLKLHFYRSLGVSATQDPKTGEYSRAVVHRTASTEGNDQASRSKADVSVISLDDKLSRGFYSSMIWDAI